MSAGIESLETRTLFSADPAAVTALLAEGKTFAADSRAVLVADAAGLKSIAAEIRAAKLTKSDATGLKALKTANAADLKVFAKAVKSVNLVVTADTKRLAAAGAAASKKPTDVKLAAKVLALKTKLSSDAAAALVALRAADGKLVVDDAATASALPGVAGTANLVVNGGFESPNVGNGTQGETNLGSPGSGIYEYYKSGTQPGVPVQSAPIDGAWQLASGSVEVLGNDPTILSPSSSTGYFQWVPTEGVQSLDLDGISAGAIYQDVPTVAGQQYTITFSIAGNPGAGTAVKTVQVTAGSASQAFTFDTTGKTPSNMGWTQQTLAFTATGSTTRLQFASLDDANSAGGPALDGISVVATPATAQSKLTTAVSTYNTTLSAAVRRLNDDATATLTTKVGDVIAAYS